MSHKKMWPIEKTKKTYSRETDPKLAQNKDFKAAIINMSQTGLLG